MVFNLALVGCNSTVALQRGVIDAGAIALDNALGQLPAFAPAATVGVVVVIIAPVFIAGIAHDYFVMTVDPVSAIGGQEGPESGLRSACGQVLSPGGMDRIDIFQCLALGHGTVAKNGDAGAAVLAGPALACRRLVVH